MDTADKSWPKGNDPNGPEHLVTISLTDLFILFTSYRRRIQNKNNRRNVMYYDDFFQHNKIITLVRLIQHTQVYNIYMVIHSLLLHSYQFIGHMLRYF